MPGPVSCQRRRRTQGRSTVPQNLARPSCRTSRKVRRSTVVILAFVVGLALTAAVPSARASDPTCKPRSSSSDWRTALAAAGAALASALTGIEGAHYGSAADQLRIMKRKTQAAHTTATALVGRPPTDPESDDPPGVAAVLKVGNFEHKLAMTLPPLFATAPGGRVLRPLAHGVIQAVVCRGVMLKKVVALKPGKRDDYVDDLSDTLPQYKQELTALATELAGDGLTSGGRIALIKVQQAVSTTATMMQRVFGGGERSVPGRPISPN
jgi:hypothetical protein